MLRLQVTVPLYSVWLVAACMTSSHAHHMRSAVTMVVTRSLHIGSNCGFKEDTYMEQPNFSTTE